MPRHVGASHFHSGSLSARTRSARRNRGRKIQSRKDKLSYQLKQRESVTS